MVSASRRARNSGQGRAERPPTRDRRVSQKDAEKPKSPTKTRRRLRQKVEPRDFGAFTFVARPARCLPQRFTRRARATVRRHGRFPPRRSPGIPAAHSATLRRDGLHVRLGLARDRATERAISARVRVAGGKSGSAESGRPEPLRALRARRGRVQRPNRRRRRERQSPSLLHAIDHASQGSHCEYSSSFPLLQSLFMRAQIESLSVHCDPGWEHFVHSWSAQVEDENEDEAKRKKKITRWFGWYFLWMHECRNPLR